MQKNQYLTITKKFENIPKILMRYEMVLVKKI